MLIKKKLRVIPEGNSRTILFEFILFEFQCRQGINLNSFQEVEVPDEVERGLSSMTEVGLRDSFRKEEERSPGRSGLQAGAFGKYVKG